MNLATQLHRQLVLNGPRATAKAAFGKVCRIFSRPKPDPWLAFDRLHNIDTSGTEIPDKADCVGDNWMQGQRYQGCNPDNLAKVLRELGPYDNKTFIDMGSGKGRALVVAAMFPFNWIVGVEYSQELNRIATDNVWRAGFGGLPITICTMDAAKYVLPPTECVIHFYNPFGEELMDRVLANIKASWRECPRKITLIYQGELCADLFNQHFRRVGGDSWVGVWEVA